MNSPNVTIIDYGVGNLLSVRRGFEHHGVSVEVTRDPNKILTSQRVVLPGVGAFPNAMKILNKLNLHIDFRKIIFSIPPWQISVFHIHCRKFGT